PTSGLHPAYRTHPFKCGAGVYGVVGWAGPRHGQLKQKRRPNRLCENVTSEGKTRQKQAEKRSLGVLNEHFPPVFNAVLPSAVVFTQSAKAPFPTALSINYLRFPRPAAH